jgi:hypothetical protein
MRLSRREWLVGGLTLAGTAMTGIAAAAAKPTITVYKSPT